MGISLNGLTPAGTYPGLIKTGDNTAISGTPKVLSDGNGNNLPMEVSTTGVNFTNQLQQSGVAVPTASQVNAKQDTLVSGTNIKTINGTSLLGSGNIPVVTSPSGIAGAIQFSDGSAFASDATKFFWDNTNKRLGVGTNAPSTTVDILPPTQTAIATQFDCFRVGYSNSTIGVTNFPAFQVQVATTGLSRFSTTLRLSGGSDTSQAYLKGFDSNLFGVMLNRAQSNLGLFSDNGIMLGNTAFAGSEGSASAMVHIKGSGTTSGTTSLLVQNSSGSSALTIKDDLSSLFGGDVESSGVIKSTGTWVQAITFRFGSFGSRMKETGDGRFVFYNNAENNFNSIQLGGTTSSFPAIKRSSTTLQARLADDSGYAPIDASLYKVGGTNGFTGTGSYTNFTIVGGIITNAS